MFGLDGPSAIFGPKLVPEQVVLVEQQALLQQLAVIFEGIKKVFRGKDTFDLVS